MNVADEMDRMWEALGPTRLSWLWGMGSTSLTLAIGVAWVGGYANWYENAHPGQQSPNWPLLVWLVLSFVIPALLVYPAWRAKAASDALSDAIDRRKPDRRHR